VLLKLVALVKDLTFRPRNRVIEQDADIVSFCIDLNYKIDEWDDEEASNTAGQAEIDCQAP
jgi:hypothetical protein